VPTWRLSESEDLKYVLAHLPELVVKEVQGSGGYGMLVGPTSSQKEIETYKQRILAEPANFIAQPTLALSTCPTMVESGVAPRHVDLPPLRTVRKGDTSGARWIDPGGAARRIVGGEFVTRRRH